MTTEGTGRIYGILILMVAIPYLGGCVGLHKVSYSRPNIDVDRPIQTRFERYVGEVFVTDIAEFYIEPSNALELWSMPLLPLPVPFPFRGSSELNAPLRIAISLRARVLDLVFDPEKISFWTKPDQKYGPTRIQGPYECNSPRPPPDWRTFPINSISLQTDRFSCLWLEVDVVPPNPRETFFVQIAGIRSSERELPLPVIRFDEIRKTDIFSVP